MSDTQIAPRIERPPLSERLSHAAPALFVPALMIIGLLAVQNPSTWLTLTAAGLAMGMMVFLMASGLTLVFGLMDIINFGHGAFVTLGAFVGFSAMRLFAAWAGVDNVVLNALALLIAVCAAMLATGLMGLAFERVIVRPVYGSHLKQILVTVGGMIVVQQLVIVLWGPDELRFQRPESFRGSWLLFDAPVEKYRVFALLLGLAVFAGLRLLLSRTRLGLLIRAGVEDREMVEALGFRIRRLFVAVFAAGSALAGLGGILWGLYLEGIHAFIGSEVTTLVFIVIIIGGLGSVEGAFIGALIVGLLHNYAAFLVPKFALVSSIALMVVVLLWRPEGFYPVVKGK